MSFDYEQMKQDIIDHWKVDMSISWKSDIVNIAKVRHRATLLGFRYDNMNLQKEIKKFEEAAKLFHRAYILLNATHPTLQRMISEDWRKYEFSDGFGAFLQDTKLFNEALIFFNLPDDTEPAPFVKIDMGKVAAIEMSIFYERLLSQKKSVVPSELPKHLNEASSLYGFLEETLPIFQVEPTNIRGAYANWRVLVSREHLSRNLPENEKEEHDKILDKARSERIQELIKRRENLSDFK